MFPVSISKERKIIVCVFVMLHLNSALVSNKDNIAYKVTLIRLSSNWLKNDKIMSKFYVDKNYFPSDQFCHYNYARDKFLRSNHTHTDLFRVRETINCRASEGEIPVILKGNWTILKAPCLGIICICIFYLLLAFWDRISLCSGSWSWIHNLYPSKVLGPQECVTISTTLWWRNLKKEGLPQRPRASLTAWNSAFNSIINSKMAVQHSLSLYIGPESIRTEDWGQVVTPRSSYYHQISVRKEWGI